ncbi:hypothetical protein PsorP6_017630 [Peronosclerospora sorghi]|uniref:Uncharacterized protein n=1 Tax=Peronosclerospora sorghi TaxID=230839 RepID=A0ACC0WLP9_9STRA|nr:hypothetical protein PsorP6_017630 [Peronosclerospora sorghi]
MLGRSIPQQSTLFISYVIVQTGLGFVLELLRVVLLLLSALFALLAPKHTRRERNTSWLVLPLEAMSQRPQTFFLLDNVYRQPALNERVPIRADYRMLVNDYDEEKAVISPEELCSEDQHLCTHVV